MENKTLNLIAVYSKNVEEIIGVFTNTDEAIAAIAKNIVDNVSLFEDFVEDYKAYLTDYAEELFRYEDDTPYTAPKCFADWIKETLLHYDSTDWHLNVTPFFAFDDVTLTLE